MFGNVGVKSICTFTYRYSESLGRSMSPLLSVILVITGDILQYTRSLEECKKTFKTMTISNPKMRIDPEL